MSPRRQFMKSINSVFHFLPIFLVNNLFIEIGNQFGHRLMIAADISCHLQVNAVGQLNRLLRAVNRIFLWPYSRKFRVGHREDEFSRELLFLRDAYHWIFHISFTFAISDGLFRRATKLLWPPMIRVSPMNSFDTKTIGQNSCPFDWFTVFVLNYNQHFFEF